MDKDVLLLRLDEVVALCADVLQVGEHVDVAARLDLAHHRVQHGVAPGPTHSRAGKSVSYVSHNLHGPYGRGKKIAQ